MDCSVETSVVRSGAAEHLSMCLSLLDFKLIMYLSVLLGQGWLKNREIPVIMLMDEVFCFLLFICKGLCTHVCSGHGGSRLIYPMCKQSQCHPAFQVIPQLLLLPWALESFMWHFREASGQWRGWWWEFSPPGAVS